ncbi:MAG TPA: hypothetical protein VFM16_03295 [Holophagaceae bacterium]|nr:hypothetical protein [Holophagaceae bacterium]
MRTLKASLALPLASLLLAAGAPPAAAPKADGAALSGIGARNLGPAVMGGRIAALDGFLDKGRVTLYVGAAGGGVWKTQNGGTTFKPVFDKHVQSIGAIKVDPSNPSTVWVGTGEAWTRNSVSTGDGIYKSTDGGETWSAMGLKDSEHIAQIAIDPKDGNTVYAACLGHLWSPGGERGLYKTTDGGRTWTRILFVDEDTGCASIAMDPQHPGTLFATTWQFRRTPYSFSSGGPGGGLYKSTDGGASWVKLNADPKRGLPQGELGRSAFAVAPSDPKVVYALVEAKDGGLFRSDDGGETWSRRSNGADVIIRPFYFCALFVDPKNPDRLYKPGLNFILSEDGGKTFSVIGQAVHSDWHAAWIDPSNPEHLFAGTDGGFYETVDRGTTWTFHQNLPIGQYYHVTVDQARPYNLYGGLQDNSAWRGPSATGGGIENRHWNNLWGGDGFWVQPDPTDPNYAYAEAQGGEAGRINLTTHEARSIKPEAGAGEPKYRWNWNTPIQVSPNDPKRLYMACQFLFRSTDHGASWTRISPDLTTDDKKMQDQDNSGGITLDNSSAETHCTIFTVSESPKDPDLIWAGTDDGNLQLTRDGGKTWTNTASAIPGLPKGTWAAWVEASPYAAGTAFACFDGHWTGDMRTYVYMTTDFGRSWRSLGASNLEGWAHVVKQDPVNPDLLYLGTERGLWISLDRGASWARFEAEGWPKAVAVDDLAFQTREGDLAIATHGRSLWVVDDLAPLRALSPAVRAQASALLPARPSVRSNLNGNGWSDGDAQFNGRDPKGGAEIAYWQKKRHIFGDLKVEVLGQDGKVIATLPGAPRRGLNRLYWPMTLPAPRIAKGTAIAGGGFSGPRALEGTYTVRMTDGDKVRTGTITLVPDPLSPHTAADRKAQFELSMELYRMQEDLAYEVDRMVDLRDQAEARAAAAKDPALKASLAAFAKAVEASRAACVPVKSGGGITGEEKLRDHLATLYGTVTGYDGRPGPANYARRDALKQEMATTLEPFHAEVAAQLPKLDAALQAAGQAPLKDLARADWERTTAPGGAPAAKALSALDPDDAEGAEGADDVQAASVSLLPML